MRIVLGEVN